MTLCGIRHFFAAAGLDFPSGHPQIRMLIKGVGRLDAARRQKAPVSVALLEQCADALDLNDPADQALWGVLCLAFFFMLRRSEIAATTNTKFKWFALKAADVSTLDTFGTPMIDPSAATTVCIRLTGSKSNQGAPPRHAVASAVRRPNFVFSSRCPPSPSPERRPPRFNPRRCLHK
ncbi:hypothetical protein PF005_g2854 [Phytophthora fragariae]|uniref:Tyr recombinase domain-containing protein n=1 Tax=Phytophthora fragariae TaxID=53985 RepID=A0A6A3Z9U9_9STRA|nr:hypothetical protein PF005_g2854 [Phytophthora fragariae]